MPSFVTFLDIVRRNRVMRLMTELTYVRSKLRHTSIIITKLDYY